MADKPAWLERLGVGEAAWAVSGKPSEIYVDTPWSSRARPPEGVQLRERCSACQSWYHRPSQAAVHRSESMSR